MKKIAFISFSFALLTTVICSYSQTTDPVAQRENCLKTLAEEKKQEFSRLENSYFEENPDPSKYVYLACDGHFPKYRCVKHKKQCSGSCACLSDYTNQSNHIEASYKARENGCQQDYEAAIAKKNSQEEQNILKINSPENDPTENRKATERQQYQNDAIGYLTKGQDKNQSYISRSLNLDLAKINATMAGDVQQVNKIQQIQNQQRQAENQELVNSAIAFHNSLQHAAAVKQQRLSESLNRDVRSAGNGDMYEIERLARDYEMGNKYRGIPKDKNESFYWYGKAADLGDTCSLFKIAFELYVDSEEFNVTTKASSFQYVCTAYVLRHDLGKQPPCHKPDSSNLRTVITDALFYQFASIRDRASTELLFISGQLFKEKMERVELNMNYGRGLEKKLAKYEHPILKEYIQETESKTAGLPVPEQVPYPILFETFIHSNMLNRYSSPTEQE